MEKQTENKAVDTDQLKIGDYYFSEIKDFWPLNIMGYSCQKDSLFFLLMECIVSHGHNTLPTTILSIANDTTGFHEEKEILAAKMILTYFKK